MLWIFIVLFLVNFSNIINFGADSNNHITRITSFKTIAEGYDGYPIAWHQIFKFESDLATYLLFDKIVFWVGIYIITAILIGLSVLITGMMKSMQNRFSKICGTKCYMEV